MKLTSFDGLSLTEYNLEEDTAAAVNFMMAYGEISGVAGMFDHYGDEHPRQILTIRRKAQIVAASFAAVDTALSALRAKAVLGRRWLVATDRNSNVYGTWAKLTEVKVSFSASMGRGLNVLPVDLTFKVAWPWWEDTSDIWYLDAGEVLDDGLTFDSNYSSRSGAGSLTITNNGDDAIRRGLIVIKGSSTNPTVTNATNGWSIAYSGAVASGSTLFIEFGAQTARLDGASAWSNITLGSDQAGMFRLEVGSNSIAFTGGGTLEIHWAEVY